MPPRTCSTDPCDPSLSAIRILDTCGPVDTAGCASFPDFYSIGSHFRASTVCAFRWALDFIDSNGVAFTPAFRCTPLPGYWRYRAFRSRADHLCVAFRSFCCTVHAEHFLPLRLRTPTPSIRTAFFSRTRYIVCSFAVQYISDSKFITPRIFLSHYDFVFVGLRIFSSLRYSPDACDISFVHLHCFDACVLLSPLGCAFLHTAPLRLLFSFSRDPYSLVISGRSATSSQLF